VEVLKSANIRIALAKAISSVDVIVIYSLAKIYNRSVPAYTSRGLNYGQ
jgi:hypothetical protein